MTTERERFDAIANKAAGWALVALTIPMWWWDDHWPPWVVAIINPALVVGIAWAFSRWKRCMLSRVLFWAVLGIYAVSLIVGIATAFRGLQVASGWYTTAGLAVLGIIWALWRMPKVRAAAPQVSHVVHHHVLHQPGAELPALDAAGREPRSLAAVVRRAIEAPKVMPGHIAEAVRQAVRRGDRP